MPGQITMVSAPGVGPGAPPGFAPVPLAPDLAPALAPPLVVALPAPGGEPTEGLRSLGCLVSVFMRLPWGSGLSPEAEGRGDRRAAAPAFGMRLAARCDSTRIQPPVRTALVSGRPAIPKGATYL